MAGVADMGFPLRLTFGASAAAGGQHQLRTAVSTIDHPGEQGFLLGVEGNLIVAHRPVLHDLLCMLI